ncbi:hypothetical protein RFI_36375 [Reticulomyxa filosa]|uniref:Uncharacterized protein n=1 Tax=Reticulomyxa filosa TaxID=46433 RepID=X6LK14_RETFI|nr:hypothetical protein RFI_36375 [Reticulomyxa filosa]|eukprot:ETO01065.1 hypothetical protein RFI_36375 [Reticulomyxa filosa]
MTQESSPEEKKEDVVISRKVKKTHCSVAMAAEKSGSREKNVKLVRKYVFIAIEKATTLGEYSMESGSNWWRKTGRQEEEYGKDEDKKGNLKTISRWICLKKQKNSSARFTEFVYVLALQTASGNFAYLQTRNRTRQSKNKQVCGNIQQW